MVVLVKSTKDVFVHPLGRSCWAIKVLCWHGASTSLERNLTISKLSKIIEKTAVENAKKLMREAAERLHNAISSTTADEI